MKWIKTYNEAIGPNLTKKVYDEKTGATQSVGDVGMNPSTFRSASNIARSNRQMDKAKQLEDWANIKEYGYYNLNVWINYNARITHDIQFTKCEISNVRWGVPNDNESATELGNLTMEDVVNNWEQGKSKLGITFDVGFKITNEGKSKLQNSDIWNNLRGSYGNDRLFSISLLFSNRSGLKNMIDCRSCEGSGYWCCDVCEGHGVLWTDDDERVKCEECDGKGEIPCPDCNGKKTSTKIRNNSGEMIDLEFDESGKAIYDVQAFYEDTKKFSLFIIPTDMKNSTYVGFFADKRSAIEFTRDLPKLVSENKDINKKIRELLNLLSHQPSEDLKEIIGDPKAKELHKKIGVFGHISNNKIFPDRAQTESSSGVKSFFWRQITI
jgi:hypothetical protein